MKKLKNKLEISQIATSDDNKMVSGATAIYDDGSLVIKLANKESDIVLDPRRGDVFSLYRILDTVIRLHPRDFSYNMFGEEVEPDSWL